MLHTKVCGQFERKKRPFLAKPVAAKSSTPMALQKQRELQRKDKKEIKRKKKKKQKWQLNQF